MIGRREFVSALSLASAHAAPSFQLATFQADVTPPVGSPIYTGTAKSIVQPLEARGFLFTGAGAPVALVSVDWCEIRNRSYELWRSALAKAAGTTPERVLVSCIHPHDAPYTDAGAQEILSSHQSPYQLCDPAFERQVVDRVAAALRNATPRRITAIGTGQARVKDVASNRRYLLPDGKVSFGRTSATRDPAIRAMPEGLIDPYLKMISFWDGSEAVAALSCYSTHPMSYYGKGDVTPDFPGIARSRMQSETPRVFQIYASGCSGDTMAGRYNDGSPENRPALAGKLHQAMQEAWKATRTVPITRTTFRCAKLRMAPRSGPTFSLEDMRRIVADPSKTRTQRFEAALGLSWRKRLDSGSPIDVPALDFGSACLVVLPGEAFVQYQLWAQQARPKDFVVTLGYGECAPGYIPTNSDVAEGYDDHYSWVDLKTSESAMRKAIQAALR